MFSLPDAIDFVRPSIVQIGAHDPNSGSRIVLGTGFFVSERGFVTTAGHVVDKFAEIAATLPALEPHVGLAIPDMDRNGISIRASYEMVGAELVERDSRHDLALLHLSANPFESDRPSGLFETGDGGFAVNAQYGLAQTNASRPRDGEAIAVSGYPLSVPSLVTTSGAIASAWGSDTKEIPLDGAPAGFSIPDVRDSYFADVAVNPGNSGGPVYKIDTGEVIGVCVAFRIAEASIETPTDPIPSFYNSGLSVVVPIQYALDLLARHA